MTGIIASASRYDDWMRKQLRGEAVKKDLAHKHDKMRESPFVFLRASYWRWAETILDTCPDLRDAPAILCVGDIHLENFGTWRDVDGRLVWGVNDFDEAADMPFALDLVRLLTSALVASTGRGFNAEATSRAILAGYREGLRAPKPIVLDRDWGWLRELLVVSGKQRARFWQKIEAGKREVAPARYRKVLASAMPEPRVAFTTARRTAGTGSLGRPRWIGIAVWRGAPVVREAKTLLPSAWSLSHNRGNIGIRCHEIASGQFRALDPWYRIADGAIVRRLSPNNRKIEAEKGVSLVTPDMLRAMGRELANIHLGTKSDRAAIQRDLRRRKGDWLLENAKKAAAAIIRDYKDWKAV